MEEENGTKKLNSTILAASFLMIRFDLVRKLAKLVGLLILIQIILLPSTVATGTAATTAVTHLHLQIRLITVVVTTTTTTTAIAIEIFFMNGPSQPLLLRLLLLLLLLRTTTTTTTRRKRKNTILVMMRQSNKGCIKIITALILLQE